MYPYFRMTKEVLINLRAAPLALTDTHISRHICWPWDLDFWMELNNGRTLTLLDLGRIPFSMRIGLAKVLRQQKWGMTMAGVSVRYRRRVRAFQKVEVHTKLAGWDDRFVYLDQTMWRNGNCTSQALYRSAVTDANGIVPTAKLNKALGANHQSPPLPQWVTNWIDAEATRPWPPIEATTDFPEATPTLAP